MKIFHLSDLHLGKRVNEFSMIEDQEYILKQILKEIDKEKPNCIIIAGDIYDKQVPSAEAVCVFDDFLVQLSNRKLDVFVISGNHDSPERIAFGGRLMHDRGIHMSPVYDGAVSSIQVEDEFGVVNFWMLPFFKPAHVRGIFECDEIKSYTDAVSFAVKQLNINNSERNVMIAHQFVTGAEHCDSEELSVGGTDNVDVDVFEQFDYTALGHIHRPQNCKGDRVRYSGTPLKYSFSEVNDKKSITVVELKEKGNLSVSVIPLIPKHDMVEIKGKYNEIMLRDFYKNTDYQDAYTHIILTDEEDIPDIMGKLRQVYHNLMKIDYDNRRTRENNVIEGATNIEKKSPLEHFAEFYEKQNNQAMNDEQNSFVSKLIEKIWED